MLKDNLDRVRQRIAAASARAGRDPAKISLVCVTKGQPVERAQEAVKAGCIDIGENRVQEALSKSSLIQGARWHMIGHLQSNKAKDAVKIFDLIHSVDSLSLAEEINRQAQKTDKVQEVLLEAKTSEEATKSGFALEELAKAVDEILKLRNLKIKGLMTIAALTSDPEGSRKYFSLARQLRDKLNPGWLLSMGMSDDFEVAIEEGADIIRLGRAIFDG